MGQLQERGADACAADAKGLGEVFFDQFHARFKTAIKDRVEHFLIDHFLRAQLAAAFIAAGFFGLGHLDDAFRRLCFRTIYSFYKIVDDLDNKKSPVRMKAMRRDCIQIDHVNHNAQKMHNM